MTIGMDPAYGPFSGYIDEVLVCPFEVTEDEMTAHFSGQGALQDAGMVPSSTGAPATSTTAPDVTQKPVYTYRSIQTAEATCGHNKYWNAGENYATNLAIVGGVPASANEFPWYVALVSGDDYGNIQSRAVVINENWLLTAAHLFEDGNNTYTDATQWMAFVGEDGKHLAAGTNQEGYMEYYGSSWSLQASEIILHPQFNTTTWDYDFALIRIDTSLTFNNWAVQPICLPKDCEETCQTGDMAEIAGYGDISEGWLL